MAKIPELNIRYASLDDAPYLTRWLNDPQILRWFPMVNMREIEDAVRVWVGYSKLHAGLTAEWSGVPCGMANLYIQPYKKLVHQCLFSIIVDATYRSKGIGRVLIEALSELAKQHFRIEILHLEVYEGNPAINLYRRLGFKEYGLHKHFIKEHGQYMGKILMQKTL